MRAALALACLAAIGVSPLMAAGPFDEPLATVPPLANSLVTFDIKKILNSPIGQKEDWAGRTKDKYRSGAGMMPPGAERVVIAGQVNFSHLGWNWQAVVVDAPDAPDIPELTRREKGELDSLADRPTILSPRGAYFTTLNPSRMVVFHPADRQEFSRWLRRAQTVKAPSMSKYLGEASASVADSPLTIALDLNDSIDPNTARVMLGAMVSTAKSKVDMKRFARTLASVRGLTLTTKFEDTIKGSLRIDFNEGIGDYRPLLQPLLVELLEMEGAAIPELAGWTATFPDKAMVLTGDLTPQAMFHLISLFTFPDESSKSMADEPNEKGPTLNATKRYFETVQTIVADLRKMRDTKDYNKTAAWHESAAKKIDQLSIRNVDPAAVDYAKEVSGRIWAIAGSLRGVPVEVNRANNSSFAYGYVVKSGWGGWWGGNNMAANFQTNLPEMRAKMADAVANDEKMRVTLWNQVDEMGSRLRATLTQKYPGF